MRYAIIENGNVTNVIVIYEGNAHEFPNAVPTGDAPVQIGDAYASGRFTRGGEPLYSPLEQTIADLDTVVVDLTYQNILLEMGV